ncbi:MAG: L-lactate permease [Candidatus Pacebacteria bacterium]|nr:L-lactate permease [Candidatus Paceibacterota bacterium]
MLNLPFVLSVIPFVVFLLLLLWKKMPLLKVSLLTLILTAALAFFYWKIIPVLLLVSSAKGFFIALDIFIIILGAIFFLEILKDLKVIDSITYYLESFSKDYRIQVIILAWFFENFLEGTAGFGTAAVIIAPLLIALGLSPIKTIIISLLGNSTSVAFGAAGTPIRVGFAGLDYPSIPQLSAWINCIGFIVPIFMLLTLVADKTDKRKQFWEALPFAIWAGIAFVIPSALTVFLGQEFPSILGSVIGLLLVLLTTKLGIFVPKNIIPAHEAKELKPALSPFKTLFPYSLLIILLIFGKILLGTISFSIPLDISHKFNLFNPGFAFILAGIPVALLWSATKYKIALQSVKIAFKSALEPLFVIASVSIVVQLMINSGQNLSGLPSSIALIAKNFETTLLPLWTPFISAFGCFITGSATVSNLMFGNFLNFASQAINMNSAKILALALVGGAAGNMIALADMLAAEAVVGLKNQERAVLKGVIIPCLIYLILTGIIGMLII